MSLSESQKKLLRGLGHKLSPVVFVGDGGLSDSVLKELDSTLDHHELIKVRVRAGDRDTRDAIIAELCSLAKASLIQRIGNVALIYRPNPENKKHRKNMPESR
jgi:RNA-binding protein